MAPALIAPTDNPHVLTTGGLRRLLICFSSSDDWRALVAVVEKLALPGNGAVQVCYKDLTNLYALSGTRLTAQRYRVPSGSQPSSLQATRALREMGLNVELTDLPALRGESRQKLSSNREADLIVMTMAFSSSIALCSENLASRAVRLLEKPILFVRADHRSAAPQSRTGSAVAAVSLSERSMPVVLYAARCAETLGSALTVVHVIDSLHDFSRPDNLMSLACACETLGKSVAHPHLRTNSRLTYGTVADVLTHTDLIADAPFMALGVDLSETETEATDSDALREMVVRNAPCPVLLVPSKELCPSA